MKKSFIIFLILFLSNTSIALERIVDGITEKMTDNEQLFYMSTRCDALFLSQVNRISAELAAIGDVTNNTDETKNNVRKTSDILDTLIDTLSKVHLFSLKIGEAIGETEQLVNIKVLNLSSLYDKQRSVAYIGPNGFTSIEEDDIRFCGAFLKELGVEIK